MGLGPEKNFDMIGIFDITVFELTGVFAIVNIENTVGTGKWLRRYMAEILPKYYYIVIAFYCIKRYIINQSIDIYGVFEIIHVILFFFIFSKESSPVVQNKINIYE